MSSFPVPETSGQTPHDAEVPSPADGLTERERQILDFERQWWKYAGAKEQALRDRLDLSPTRYYQQLNVLLDSPSALAYDAMLIKRLRRLRGARRRGRTEPRFTPES